MLTMQPATLAARAYLLTLFVEGCDDEQFPELWLHKVPRQHEIWQDLRHGSRRALNFILGQLETIGYERAFMIDEARRAAKRASGDVRKVVTEARRRPIRRDEEAEEWETMATIAARRKAQTETLENGLH